MVDIAYYIELKDGRKFLLPTSATIIINHHPHRHHHSHHHHRRHHLPHHYDQMEDLLIPESRF